jgi:integrin-linked kinase
MPRGSLHDLIIGAAGGVVIDNAQAVRFCTDIARGMAYLHSLERIIPEYHLNSYHVMVNAIKRTLTCLCQTLNVI